MLKKEERRDGNLSVEFLCSTLELLWVIHQIRLCYLDDPNSLSILLLPFFLYSLVALCLDAYVNLTFMSCKTELSLINHLVILSCHLVSLKVLRDQSRYLQESVASTSPSPDRERVAKTSAFSYIKLQEVDGKRCISFQLTEALSNM